MFATESQRLRENLKSELTRIYRICRINPKIFLGFNPETIILFILSILVDLGFSPCLWLSGKNERGQ